MNRYQLDQLDRDILDLLGNEARTSNRKIAARLGVTEGTIRSRLKRLQEENYLRFTAVSNVALVGNPRLVFIGITAKQARVRDLADQIADMPGIRSVIITLGRFNILAIGMFNDLEDLLATANNSILALPGVHHVETSVAVRTLKYDARMAKITRPFVETEEDDEDEE